MRACPILLCSRSSPFTEADPASHKRACTRGRISPTFTRKVGLRWTCVRSFCLSRQPSAYVARKDPTSPSLLATRNLRTAIERVRSDLVLEESQSPKENLYQETPRPLQEAWGRVNDAQACHCRRFEKDGMEKSDFRAAKKGGKKTNPIEQSFAHLSERSD